VSTDNFTFDVSAHSVCSIFTGGVKEEENIKFTGPGITQKKESLI
jgi:hypothetical protein